MYFGNRDLAVLKDLCDCGVYGSTYPCGPSWGRGGGGIFLQFPGCSCCREYVVAISEFVYLYF